MKKSNLTIRAFFFMLVCSMLFVSCNKEGCTDPSATNYSSEAEEDDGSCEYDNNTNNNTNNNTDPIDGNPQASFDVDGNTISIEESTNILFGTSSDKEIGQTTTTAIWSSFIYDDTQNYTLLDVQKGIQTYPTGNLDEDDFLAYFAPGTYSFADLSDEGVAIIYGTPNGDYYSSKYGPQTGSTFEIISSEKIYYGWDLYIKVHVEFSCKVYNTNNSNDVKTITNGMYVGTYAE